MTDALITALVILIVGGYFWTQDHRSLKAQRDAETKRADGLAADLLERDGDLAELREKLNAEHGGSMIHARERRIADEKAFKVAEDFRRHLDAHACLPTLDGIKAGVVGATDGRTPIYEGMSKVVVPMRKRSSR